MKSVKFVLKEKSKAGKVFLLLEFEGGDADTNHPELVELNQSFSLDFILSEESLKLIDDYKVLKRLLDNHRIKCHGDYDEIKEEHGEEIANLYDYTPNDPQNDYQFKCYLSDITLIGYDEKGNEYKAYL